MKIVPFTLIEDTKDDPFADEDTVTYNFDRHIPENEFEKQLYFLTISYAILLSGKQGAIPQVPLKSIKHLAKGSCAYLLLDPANWDDQGRLRFELFIEPEQICQEPENEFHKYPIFYSVVSTSNRQAHHEIGVLYEFAPTPFNKTEQWGISVKERRPQLLPFLETPQGHPLYEKEKDAARFRAKNVQNHSARAQYIPQPSGDEFDDGFNINAHESTETWLAGMSADERVSTMNNLDWND